MRFVFQQLEPVFIKEGAVLLKTGETFISRDGQSLLVESLVMDGPNKILFFSAITKRPDGLVVRIYPLCEVPKPKPVFRLVAEIGKRVMKAVPGLSISKTNLQEFLG